MANSKKNGHGKKDRLDRIEELLEANAKQIAANTKGWAKTKEFLDMAAAQTIENAKQLQHSRKEHDREMKEIRLEITNFFKRLAF